MIVFFRWSPVFFNLETESEVVAPATYELRDGYPSCDAAASDTLFPVYHHESTFDDLMLLSNGSLAHREKLDQFTRPHNEI
jgi:hypothetical protein